MNPKFFLAAFCFALISSCTKNGNNPVAPEEPKYKLKAILYPIDSEIPLCENCPPTITQQSQSFIYDSLDRLISRIAILTILSDTPVNIDSFAVYSYFYSDNSSLISSYTETVKGYTTSHMLTYNSQNLLTSDSVTNPQISNNKVSYFKYLQDYVIVTDKQTYPIGTETITDTVTVHENNVTKEIITQIISGIPQHVWNEELAYSFTTYHNPLSLVNNISLLGSDCKNVGSAIFYNGENFSNNLASQKITKYWSKNLPLTEYTSIYTPTLDSLGRVISVMNSGDGNGITSYEYY